MKKNAINISIVSSEKYAPYLATTLASLLDHLDKSRILNIYILTEDFSDASKEKILKLKSIHDFNIKYIYLKEEDYSFLSVDIKCPVHVARVAASRILLPKLLNNINKVLTLECDQLINDDIAKLYDIDLDDYVMGAVEDFASKKHSKDLWNSEEAYYNCGVCLIDLEKLREINYMELFKRKIAANGYRYQLQEQDIWNDGLKGQIKRLDIRWNLYHCFYNEDLKRQMRFEPVNTEEYQKACLSPGIYHFVSEEKCWFPTVKKPYIKEYRKYEKMTPFYSFVKYHKYSIARKEYRVITLGGKIVYKKIKEKNNSNTFIEELFSIKNSSNKKHKVVTLLGIKFKIKKKTTLEQKLRNIIREELPYIVTKEVSQILKIQRLHQDTFPQFKYSNTGKNLAIIGCGPTIQYYNNELCTKNIALNKAILIDKIKFDYLFVWDYAGFLEKGPTFFRDVKDMSCVKFFGKFINERIPSIPDFPDDKETNVYHFYSSARHGLLASATGTEIHPDIENYPLVDFMSISFAAIQFALYTHPKKLYLIGLDTKQCGHYAGDNNKYDIEKMFYGYRKIKEFVKLHYPDIEIISVNPVGLKGMFRDVYTQSYVDEHPELSEEDVEILSQEENKELVNI